MPTPTLEDLRRFAVARSLFVPTTLGRAITKLGFVQADPIRAPARAQDLTLRHRVKNYQAGDLEKHYPRLAIEEDYFVNYGYLPRATQALMHPRTPRRAWSAADLKIAKSLVAFVRDRSVVHPREVDAHFAHGKTTNWFGGTSNASTQLLDRMHYSGMLRIEGRQSGTRLYALRELTPAPDSPKAVMAALDALVDVFVNKYAPLPAASLGQLVSRLMVGVPQWRDQRSPALQRAKTRLSQARVEGIDWFWPSGVRLPRGVDAAEGARLLAPFDPVVWDRQRFELFWAWAYRFEAYTPAPKRKLGYYAMPLLWRDQVVGWGNAAQSGDVLSVDIGLVSGHRLSQALRGALDVDVAKMATFLGLIQSNWCLRTR